MQSHDEGMKVDFRRVDNEMYGREHELLLLNQVYNRVTGLDAEKAPLLSPCEIILLSGRTGVGKSKLIEQFITKNHLQPLAAKREHSSPSNYDDQSSSSLHGNALRAGKKMETTVRPSILARGKFQQPELGGGTEPFSAIFSVLEEATEQIMKLSDETKVGLIDDIKAVVGQEQGEFLSLMIPKLEQIFGPPQTRDATITPKANIGTVEAQNKLSFLFQSFIRTVSSNCRVFVLYLDDLQWADPSSFALIGAVLIEADVPNLFLLGSFRDDEVGPEHPLTLLINDMNKGGASMLRRLTKIEVGNLHQCAINQLVSGVLNMDIADTESLAEVVYERTGGNALFAIKFLDSLQDSNLLAYCFASCKWIWIPSDIRSRTDASDNIADLLTSKILRTPKEIQSVLMIASCLGYEFNADLLTEIIMSRHENPKTEDGVNQQDTSEVVVDFGSLSNREDVQQALNYCLKEGIIEELLGASYKFAHDKLLEAAYSIIPDGKEREQLHLYIGRVLLPTLETDGDYGNEFLIFVVANQLNRGRLQIQCLNDKVELASLNLRVGRRAMELCAFVLASDYLDVGIDLLRSVGDLWKDYYNLAIELFSASSEMAYSTGNFLKCETFTTEILANARSLNDKMPAYFARVHTLTCQLNFGGALSLGLKVLKQLGEPFPKKVGTPQIMKDVIHTNILLRGKSDEVFLMLPKMTDKNKLAAMQMLKAVWWCSLSLGSPYLVIFVLRMIRLTVRNGICNLSALGFAGYGMLLCGPLKGMKKGQRFGKLALALQDRIEDQQWRGRTHHFVYTFIYHWGGPLQNNLTYLLEAYSSGMIYGDVEISMLNGFIYCLFSICSGRSLAQAETDTSTYAQRMSSYKQSSALEIMLPFQQYILNLIGQCDNSVELTGDAMNQTLLLQKAEYENNYLLIGWTSFLVSELAYLFGDLELASQKAAISRKYFMNLKTDFSNCRCNFIDGLICIALAKKTKEKKWRKGACIIIKRMSNWLTESCGNVLHYYLLLKAEMASLTKKQDIVKDAYDLAIKTAGKSGFIQDRALGNERAALYLSEVGDEISAKVYMSQAYKLYKEWGALGKAEHLVREHSFLLDTKDGDVRVSKTFRRKMVGFNDNSATLKNLRFSEIKSSNISIKSKSSTKSLRSNASTYPLSHDQSI